MALLVAACAKGSADPSVTDADALPTLSLVEELRIGSVDDPDVGFSQIDGVAVDVDGNVFVFEYGDFEIRAYTPDGELLRRFGRRGQGPGEFASPTNFGVKGDTVWVHDWQLQRFTLFNRAGTLITTLPATPVHVRDDGTRRISIYPSSLRRDGLYDSNVMWSSLPRRGSSERDTLLIPQVRFDGSGTIVDTIGTYRLEPDSPASERIDVGTVNVMPIDPPSDRPYETTIDDDSVTIERPMSATGAVSTFVITRVRAGRDTVFRTELSYRPRPFTSAHADSLVRSRVASYRDRPGADTIAIERTLREHLKMPPYQPPVTSTRRGSDGVLWVRRENSGDTWRWLLVEPDGAVRGRVEVPRRTRIRWSGGDRAWAVELDENDVPWLVRYRISGR